MVVLHTFFPDILTVASTYIWFRGYSLKQRLIIENSLASEDLGSQNLVENIQLTIEKLKQNKTHLVTDCATL